MGLKAKKWVKVQNFDGFPKESDFRLEEEELEKIKDGEFLCEAEVLSVDPYMRLFGNTLPDGATLMGEQVARVTESRNADYPVGSHVSIQAGWRTLTVCDGKKPEVRPLPPSIKKHDLPHSLALGAVGMPGTTAYFGLHDIASLKDGETLLVNGAAGAVGTMVGQLAKAQGCTVIGVAGTEAKLKYLTEELGFDHVINYKTCEDLGAAIDKAAPDGVDVFYDNVGSDQSVTVMSRMKACGRVVVGGSLASYNDKGGPGSQSTGVLPYHHILLKTLTVRGFTLWQFWERRPEAEEHLTDLIKQGKLKYEEKRVEGFEKMVQAFLSLLSGDNIGKTVIIA